MAEQVNIQSEGVNMTTGNPYKLITAFALPLLLGNVFQQLYNTADSIIVGRFIGPKALAAVGSGFPFMMMLVGLFIGLGMAASVMISQAYGANDLERIDKIIGSVYRLCLIGTPLVMILGFILARPILIAMNVPNDGTLDMAVTYLRIIFLGFAGSMGYNLNAGLLQGVGNSKASLRFLIMATIINIVLDLIFVVPLNMGVGGAALATIIAQWASWIVGIVYINRTYSFMNIDFRKLSWDKPIAVKAVRMGIPSGLQQMVFSIGMMVLNTLINGYGSSFIAGYQAGGKIDAFVFMPLQSFGNAIVTFTGQNVGAGNLERVRKGLKSGMILMMTVTVGIILLLWPLSGFAVRLFTTDAEVIAAGVQYLHQILPFYPLLALMIAHNSILRGVGQMMVPLVGSFIALWFARVPAAYILDAVSGSKYVFYCYAIGWVIGCIFVLVYYYSGRWHKLVKPGIVDAASRQALAAED